MKILEMKYTITNKLLDGLSSRMETTEKEPMNLQQVNRNYNI